MKNFKSHSVLKDFKTTKLFNFRNMQLVFIGYFMISNISLAQSGSNCSESTTVTSSYTCNYSNFTTSGTEFWLKFTAMSPTVNISLITTKFGIDAPHIHALKLFEGTCSSLNLIADDELAFYDEAKELSIDLNASNLIIGQEYFIRAERELVTQECTKMNCKLNGSTNPTTFSLCIENITVIIPPDEYGEKPVSCLALETNRGQLLFTDGTPADEVLMYNQRTNPNIYICKDHISFVHHGVYIGDTSVQRIDMLLEGANANYKIFKTEQVAGITNYYLPHIPDGITRNKSYSRVVLNDIYPNIDLQHYSNIAGMKNYYVVRPGGNYDAIIMKFAGATNVTIDNGNLNIVSELGTIHFEKPHVYYVNPAGQVVNMPFEVEYLLLGAGKVKFNIPNYSSPPPMTLVIQMDQGHSDAVPKNINNLLWSTYYGNTEEDYINDIDHDESGNIYFTGWTRGLTFPHTTQTIYGSSATNGRIIAGCHKPLGERIWTTIYGAQAELGQGIALDHLGNVYVAGVTAVGGVPNQFIDYPRVGAFNFAPLSTAMPAVYATLYRFNQNNGARTWATLFGEHNANAWFDARCITTDNAGNIYIAGVGKRILNSPIVGSGPQYVQNNSGTKVGFIAKFNAANALTWSTMFGNDNLVINEMNTVYNPNTSQTELFIVGTTTATNTTNFPLVSVEHVNDYQSNFSGGSSDAFFAKFNSSDNLRWSSFFGGAGDDLGLGIDYNYGNNNLIVTGETKSSSTTFPLQSLSNPEIHFNNILSGVSDGYLSVLKFVPETTGGHTLYYSSYFGGSSEDLCGKVEISQSGNVYVIGMSKSQNFPLQNLSGNYFQPVLENDPAGQHFDSFILGLNPNLSYGWGTYFGGEWYYNGSNLYAQSDDTGNGITVFNDEILYIGGSTVSHQNFPITVDLIASPNAFIQYENSGSAIDTPIAWSDGFLAQFDIIDLVLGLDEINSGGMNGTFSVYPNPSNGNFSIIGSNLKMAGKINLEVVNVIGQSVYSKHAIVSNGELVESIDLGNISDGIYIVKIGNGTDKISTKLVVK